MKRRVISILLALVMTVMLMPFYYGESYASTNGHTQAEAVAWANQRYFENWGRDLDGNGLWCIDLIHAYRDYLGVPRGSGHAYTYQNENNIPDGWSKMSSPQPGDIVVIDQFGKYNKAGYTTGQYGHVGIVTEVNGNEFVYISTAQNQTAYPEACYVSYAACFVHPDFSSNQEPIGWFDAAEGKDGALYVKGWAFDPDEPTKQLTVHIYVGGGTGSGASSYALLANKKRQDVDDMYHCGAYHGFSGTIKVKESGSKQIFAYAIDTQGGNNPLIPGSPITTTISADKKKPTISNIKVTNVSSTGYTVTADVSDNVGVKEVTFPTWTEPDGQDDLVWHKGTVSNGKATCRIKTADHKRQAGCKYYTDIYAKDYAGNEAGANTTALNAPRVKVPSPITNVKVTNIDASGYTVSCDVDTAWGVKAIQFPSWTVKNGQDDLIWHEGTISNGKSTYRVLAKDHGNARCEEYITHIYVWDDSGNANCVVVDSVTNHSVTDWTVDKKATFSADGSRSKRCSVCNTGSTVSIPKVTAKLDATAYTYNGTAKTPEVTVTSGSSTLAENIDYSVSYALGRKNVGTYKVTVQLKGDYSGSKTFSFKINPKGTTLSGIAAAKKGFTVKWKKGKSINGYEIQYALNSKFTKGKKSVKVTKAATVSKKVSKLKAKKKYWVRIRTYKIVSGKTYYSAWSKAKTVTTKK